MAIITSSILSFIQFGKEGVGLFSFSLFPSSVSPFAPVLFSLAVTSLKVTAGTALSSSL